jgi:integrase/recombinase XerD
MEALLATPDQQTPQGRRDYTLLLFLYNTGARASEAAQLTVGDITWGSSPSVRLVGKGNKARWCPTWPHTQKMLKRMVTGRAAQEVGFLNRLNQPLTRFGIYRLVQRTCWTSEPIPVLARGKAD